jgi:hypothetical protein
MKTTTCLILCRLLTLAFLFLLSIAVLNAQVKIHEKIEISPKVKYSKQANSGSSTNTTIPLLFGCMTTRPCIIQASGSINYEYGEGGHGYSVLYIPGMGWNYDWSNHELYVIWGTSTSAKTASFEVGECFPIIPQIYCGGGLASLGLPVVSYTDNTAEFGSAEEATATVNALPIPAYELDSITMTTYQTSLDAYASPIAFITATLLNASGNLFTICESYPKPTLMKFTIENPLDGMYLRGTNNGGSTEGTSIEGYFLGSVCYFYFVWNGGDIPHDIDTVSIRAEYLGVSGTQKIELKKIVPHHFTVTPDKNPINVGETVGVRAIAKNSNDEEVFLDGGKSITLFDESGTGSFIIGSDTIPTQTTVTYDQAKSGSIKYYSKPGALKLADEQYIWIDAFRTEYPERIGYGLIDVMPACAVVSLSPSKISPGNKTTITVMAQTAQGIIPYPADQIFIASMNADARYGTLRCEGSSGTSVTGKQPFDFIAADSLDVDSIVVNITVSPVSNGGGGGNVGSIKDGQKDTLQRHAVLMSEKHTTPIRKDAVVNIDGTKNVLVLQQEAITKKRTEQNNVLVQKAAEKQALVNAITEAIKTHKAGKGDAASARQLKAMILDLAEGDQCQRSANVTITKDKEDCTIGVPSDKMSAFKISDIEPRRYDDGPNCKFLFSPEDDGYTFVDGIGRSNDDQSKPIYNFYEGAIYAVPFKAYIDWGLCLSHNPGGFIKIKTDLSNVDSTNAKKIVDELSRMCTVAEEVPGYIPYLNYEPVEASEDHEYAHVKDYKDKMVPYYNDALIKINSIEPIRNWCHLTAEQLQIEMTHKYSEAQSIIDNMRNKFDAEVEGNKIFASTTFDNAKTAEIDGIKIVIDKIKTKFFIK